MFPWSRELQRFDFSDEFERRRRHRLIAGERGIDDGRLCRWNRGTLAHRLGIFNYILRRFRGRTVNLGKLHRDIMSWEIKVLTSQRLTRAALDRLEWHGASQCTIAREAGLRIVERWRDELDDYCYVVIWLESPRIVGEEIVTGPTLTRRIRRFASRRLRKYFRRLYPDHLDDDQHSSRLIDLERQLERRRKVKAMIYSSRTFPPILRALIMERDGGCCVRCGCNAAAAKAKGTSLEIDHILEVALGGLTCFDNGQVLCGHCNAEKEIARRLLGITASTSSSTESLQSA